MFGVHLDAKSKMAAKNNEYTPGTHWSPIRMMPARLPNALWYSIMFAWLSHIKPVQMMILYRSEKRSLHHSRWRSAAILDLWMCHRDLSNTSNITNCREGNMFLALIKCFGVILMSKRRWSPISSYENVKFMKIRITQLMLLVYSHTQLW